MRRRNLPIFGVTALFVVLIFSGIEALAQTALPVTGQTTCYNASGTQISCAGSGQDGEFQKGLPWPGTRFVRNGDTTITDTLTGLAWGPNGNIMTTRHPGWDADGTANDGKVTWQHAHAYVAQLNAENYLGYNDWRLPNKNELRSLAHYGVSSGSTWLKSATQGFTNVQSTYWSSTTFGFPSLTRYGWSVNMTDSYASISDKTTVLYYVWAVRSGTGFAPASVPKTGQAKCYNASGAEISCAGTGQDGELQQGVVWPSQRFTANGDSTITDTLTGLVWSARASGPTVSGTVTCTGGAQTWQNALNYIACINTNNYLGHHDWRLPNINEIESIIHADTNNITWLATQGFNSVQALYWSSDSRFATPSYGWAMDYSGRMAAGMKSSSYSVWPVRGGDIQMTPRISVTDSVAPDNDLQVPFGNVTEGSTATRTVTITNIGTTGLVLGIVAGTDALTAPFTITGDTCSDRTLATAQNCTVTLQFAPATMGAYEDAFDVPSNDPEKPSVTIAVSGAGDIAAPKISVADSVAPDNDLLVPFGNLNEGKTASRTVTIANSGTTDLVLGMLTGADGLAAPFTLTEDTCSYRTLAPAQNCTVILQFAPAVPGTFSDSFDIPSNDPGTPVLTMAVSGTGTAVPVPNIAVSDPVAPDNDLQVPFGTVTLGNTISRTMTVTNTGTADLVLGVIGSTDPLTAPFSITEDTCSGQTMAPTRTCALTVQLTPVTTGDFSDTFDIPSNDPDSPLVAINVNGAGISGPDSAIRIPATGQTVIHAAGDDGALHEGLPWPSPRFSITYCNASGPCSDQSTDCDGSAATDVVMDNLTGLTWPRSGNLTAGTINWADALTFADDTMLCGQSDWRLPNRQELKSLANFGKTNIHLWLNEQGFTEFVCGKYWSSTTYGYGTSTNAAWVISLCDGVIAGNLKTDSPWYVLPVRGASSALSVTGQKKCYDATGVEIVCANTGQDGELQQGIAWPVPRFTANGDETVKDSLTGLVWTKDANAPGPAACAPASPRTWLGALDYVACLNNNDYLGGGWRLPNVSELESLFHAGFKEETCSGTLCRDNTAWLTAQNFSNVQIYYWTSTTYAGWANYAWTFLMLFGNTQIDAKGADYYFVWPVRGGR